MWAKKREAVVRRGNRRGEKGERGKTAAEPGISGRNYESQKKQRGEKV